MYMLQTQKIFPIGIGTWGLGGFAERDTSTNDKKQINALNHMIENGFNYIGLNLWSAEGHSVRLVSEALNYSSKSRSEIFLSQAIYEYNNPTLADTESELEKLMKLFDTSYIDSFEFNNAGEETYGLSETIELQDKLLKQDKIRYVAVSNPSLKNLKILHKEFGEKLFSVEVGFNFEIRENYDNGIIPYLLKNNIKPVVYQPLRRNRTAKRNWKLLVDLSKKYNKTQNQIIMNWIVSLGYLPITKSETISHIDEHIDSLAFKMEKGDIKKLTDFRVPNYNPPKAVFSNSEEGVRIDQLSNVFDEEYDKQSK